MTVPIPSLANRLGNTLQLVSQRPVVLGVRISQALSIGDCAQKSIRSGTSVKRGTGSDKPTSAREYFTNAVAPVNTDVSNAVSRLSR